METMKAIQMHEFGGVDVLKYEDVARPEPRAGEVLVRVRAAGVNPADWWTRRGDGVPADTFPVILGWDISGEIVTSGTDLTDYAPGDAVYGMIRFPALGKAYAEYVTAPLGDIARKPENISHLEAAAVPLAALTAWQAIFDRAQLQPGETILIHGAAGGVGHIAAQLARWKGARVIGTASARNADFLLSLGVETVINYTTEKLEARARDVDVVLDTTRSGNDASSFRVLKRGGRLVSITGQPDEKQASAKDIQAAVISVRPDKAQLDEITGLIEANQLKINLERVLPLQEAARAHEISESGHVRGKLVLEIG